MLGTRVLTCTRVHVLGTRVLAQQRDRVLAGGTHNQVSDSVLGARVSKRQTVLCQASQGRLSLL